MDEYRSIPEDMVGVLLAPIIKDPNIGCYVQDEITGFSGIITKAIQPLTGEPYYLIESKHGPNIRNISGNRLRIINLEYNKPIKIYIPSMDYQ